ncbi:transposase [bacterium]|nr:transposase [bacterium]
MFRKNFADDETQINIPCFTNGEIDRFLDRIKGTEEASFYEQVFKNTDENIFSPLYCSDNGRPNAPVNTIFAALVLKNRNGWSYSELIKELKFNLAARYAVGIFDFREIPFNEATIFNFLNRVKDYNEQNETDLFSKMFDSITKKQVRKLRINTDTLRTDSVMLNSNIRKYGRVQLLLEVILRLYKTFSEEDQQLFNAKFSKYTETSSEKFMYAIKSSDLPHELTVIGSIYCWLDSHLKDCYKIGHEFDNFERVFSEHLRIENGQTIIKESSEVGSGSLQSPDDSDATFRTKKGKRYRGYSGTVTETCDPQNPVNLIVDIDVSKNNLDDSKILNNKFPEITEKTDVKEIHVDGAYGSTANDSVCKEHGIKMIQTAIRGRVAKVPLEIRETDTGYEVSCPNNQTVKAVKSKKRYKACFDLALCKACPLAKDCRTVPQKKCRVYYFGDDDFERSARLRNIYEIPEKRRQLRNNVEATMNEFSCKLNNHKLRVRGLHKASAYFILSAVGINFGRICRFFNLGQIYIKIVEFLFSKQTIFIFLKINRDLRQIRKYYFKMQNLEVVFL